MRTCKAHRPHQEGIALISAIMVGMILVFLATMLVWISARESASSARDLRYGSIEQVAEAGIDDYIAKLTQDRAYPTRFVHPAENPRIRSGGGTVAPGASWTFGATWTYSPTTTWRQMGNGYEYNLRVTPPAAGSNQVKLVATGRQVNKPTDTRSFEAVVRPATPLDYQMMSQTILRYGTNSVTYGKVYAGQSMEHPGQAYADVLSWGSFITPYPTRHNGAHWYSPSSSSNTGKTIEYVMKNPLNFSAFQSTLGDVKAASLNANGLNFDDANVGAWRLQFSNTGGVGRVSVQACSKATGSTYRSYWIRTTEATCNMAHAKNGTYTLTNSNGAIYVGQIALVRGTVNGRITVASDGEGIVVEDVTSYADRTDDTLGLVNSNKGVMPGWNTPNNFVWYGNLLAPSPSGTFGQESCADSHPNRNSRTMKFIGSITIYTTGGINCQFDAGANARIYEYDPNLASVQPPYFPVIEDQYILGSFREVGASS